MIKEQREKERKQLYYISIMTEELYCYETDLVTIAEILKSNIDIINKIIKEH